MAGTILPEAGGWPEVYQVSMESGLDGRNNKLESVVVWKRKRSQWSPA